MRHILQSHFPSMPLRFAAASFMMLGLLACDSRIQAAPTKSPPTNSLSQRVAQAGPAPFWLSYEIDTNSELGFICCLDRDSMKRSHGSARPGRCRPDADNHSWSIWHDFDVADNSRMKVLLRVKQGQVDRVRAYSTECQLDFENRVEKIEVTPKASLEFLTQLAVQARTEASIDHKLEMIHATLGRHQGPAADRVMADLAGDLSSSIEARRSAIFWLGQTRGAFAVKALRNLLDREPEQELQEHIVFSLSQTDTPDNQGTTELIRLLKETSSPHVRRQALLWLGSSQDPRALDLLANVLR